MRKVRAPWEFYYQLVMRHKPPYVYFSSFNHQLASAQTIPAPGYRSTYQLKSTHGMEYYVLLVSHCWVVQMLSSIIPELPNGSPSHKSSALSCQPWMKDRLLQPWRFSFLVIRISSLTLIFFISCGWETHCNSNLLQMSKSLSFISLLCDRTLCWQM